MERIKTVAVFEDLSGIGRCALSVAIPIISSLGCQACAVPTALLAAHTGFAGAVPFDNTAFVASAVSEWRAMKREFDCVLTGYMPSVGCVEAVAPFVREQSLLGRTVVVDPAMADGGKLYRSLDPAIVGAYRALCRHAGVITPNETEARLLAGRDGGLEEILDALLSLGCESAVITGWDLGGGSRANVCKSRFGETRLYRYEQLPQCFPGTGDILAACLAGYVNNGLGVFAALERASAFVRSALVMTIAAETDSREGVLLERALHLL